MKPLKPALLGFLFLFIHAALMSQGNAEKRIYNTVFTTSPPVIDGKQSDECWNSADWSGDFIQVQPEENKPPSQKTSFKILYDDNNLYVFVRAFDTEPGKISRIMTRRDNFAGDLIEINIDSYFDKQTAFSFTAMASGAKGDELVSQNGNYWDESWDPVWFLETSLDEQGWCAEIKIPFSQLRFGNKDEQIWGIQVMRHIFRLEEVSRWQYIPKGTPGMIHLFGELHGIKNIKPGRHIELLPYVVANVKRFEKVESNPFLDGKSSAISGGVDGKIGLTNDLTLDFTVNPDFGQVEADPSEVNLSAFETYFPERRPFFVEGKNIYEFEPNQTIVISKFGGDNLFYSRRIGRFPHNYPSVTVGEYVDMPDATTILGSAKVSGKTRDGLAIGVLESITADEKAIIDSAGIRRKESVEPLTNYFTGRLKQDFRKGESSLGGVFTAVNRDINNPALNYLPSASYAGGIDFYHSWKERTWYVSGNVELSHVRGTQEAIVSLQQSSARYYQRPDATHLSLDSSRTSLTGAGGTIKFGKSSQKRLQFETSLTLRSPGLDFNDLGYMRYADQIHHGTWVAYYLRNPFAIFNNFYLNTNYWLYWDFSGRLLSGNTNMNFNTQFKNRWRMNGSLTWISKRVSTDLLRGGPSIKLPGEYEINLNINTDNSKKLSGNIGNYHNYGNDNSSRVHVYWAGLNIRPFNSMMISLSPQYMQEKSPLQYIGMKSAGADTRFIFGELNMKTLTFTLRANLTITPELTIEYYGEPFISAGKYTNFNKITDPQAAKFNERYRIFSADEIDYDPLNKLYNVNESVDGPASYSFVNPDFNFRQFRSNFVVRWEYLPGSTIYLVWSQGRTGSDTNGAFRYGNDMKDLFNVVPTNIFLLKISYWFVL